jgi:hypothetical protein
MFDLIDDIIKLKPELMKDIDISYRCQFLTDQIIKVLYNNEPISIVNDLNHHGDFKNEASSEGKSLL